MAQEQLRIGLVGASWFADLWYLPVLEAHELAVPAAVCGRTADNARKMADKYHIPHIYTSYEDMMELEALDGICVVTPNDLHYPIVMSGIRRGIHVICEKPLAMSAEEAAKMAEAARESGIVHAVNFTYRESPAIRQIGQWVRDGFIGKLLEGHFEYSGGYGLSGPPGWRGTVDRGGIGGVLQDLGSHLIDIAHCVTGETLQETSASLLFLENGELKPAHASRANPNQAADAAAFTGTFPSGMHATFATSWLRPQGNRGQLIRVELQGTGGSIALECSELGVSLRYAQGGGQWEEVLPETMYPLTIAEEPSEQKFRPWRVSPKNEVWKWLDLIAARKSGQTVPADSAVAGFEAGYRVQAVIDSVVRSAQERRTVAVAQITTV